MHILTTATKKIHKLFSHLRGQKLNQKYLTRLRIYFVHSLKKYGLSPSQYKKAW